MGFIFYYDYTETTNLHARFRMLGCWRFVVMRGGVNRKDRGKPSIMDGHICTVVMSFLLPNILIEFCLKGNDYSFNGVNSMASRFTIY